MFRKLNGLSLSVTSLAGLALATAAPVSTADEHCGALGDCRVLIEMNASDGDIGLHALFDGSGWTNAQIQAPDGGGVVFETQLTDDVAAPVATQQLTENFFESTELPCEAALADGGAFKTLTTFLSEFEAGDYTFNLDMGAEVGTGPLTHAIPAAPADVDFDGQDITWAYGDDLGECVTWPTGFHPIKENKIIAYEVVMEPDDDDFSHFTFNVRVPASVNVVRVPQAYLDALPGDLPLKVEVGAIEERKKGHPFGNQTFTEEDGFCNNPNQEECPEEE